MEMHILFRDWVDAQIHHIAPNAKTVRPVDAYFATGWNDDVNVEFSRKIGGYSNHHFTVESLARFYNAEKCRFEKDYSITLTLKNPKIIV